uniref:Uncharacterized protein n=1 Tax=Cacopsylla melanoneura TaxID=428564 RepID=A0A8D9EFA1_9HEMI
MMYRYKNYRDAYKPNVENVIHIFTHSSYQIILVCPLNSMCRNIGSRIPSTEYTIKHPLYPFIEFYIFARGFSTLPRTERGQGTCLDSSSSIRDTRVLFKMRLG